MHQSTFARRNKPALVAIGNLVIPVLPPPPLPRRPSWRQQRRHILQLVEPIVAAVRPSVGELDGLSRDELTRTAQRAAKLAARATRAALARSQLPEHWRHWAARVAAARAGEPYYRRRHQLRGAGDPRCGGFYREARA